MGKWVNQTTLRVSEGKPPRVKLPDADTSWDRELPDYWPVLHEAYGRSRDLLARKGIEVVSDRDLLNLGRLSTTQATELYGPAINELRNPFGRTGLGLTGEFWQAGAAKTADIAITRFSQDYGLQLILVENRESWHIPGGFYREQSDHGKRINTAVREAEEETSMDFFALDIVDQIKELTPEHVKPRSSRSSDYGYILNQLFGVHLPDPDMGKYIRSGGDALQALWVNQAELEQIYSSNGISQDHYEYAVLAFEGAKLSL